MSSTFEKNVQRAYNTMDSSRTVRIGSTNQALEISNYIVERMLNTNQYFRKVFRGLCLNGTHLDSLKSESPDEFAIHVKLDFPFQLTPRADPNRSGFVFLISKEHHCLSDSGYLNRQKLQNWLRDILKAVIGNDVIHSGFRISYPTTGRGYGASHRVAALPINSERPLILDFIPVLEFGPNQWALPESFHYEKKPWLAVPQGIKPMKKNYWYAFMVATPYWERKLRTDYAPIKQTLKLIKTLRDVHDLTHVPGYMLKNIILLEVGKRSAKYWQKSMADLVLIVLEHVVVYMDEGFMYEMELNHFDCVAKYHKKWRNLHREVVCLKLHGIVPYAAIARLFDLR